VDNMWKGEFGDLYTERAEEKDEQAANTALFGRALSRTTGLRRILEIGAGSGMNLAAIRHLFPDASLSAVEINRKAAKILHERVPGVDLWLGSALRYETLQVWDLVFTKGFLIHVPPSDLPAVYKLFYRTARRYILLVEYYNPKPVEVEYRGQPGLLWKRDFAGDMLDTYGNLRLLNYGFVYRRDPAFPLDDLTWFLLERRP